MLVYQRASKIQQLKPFFGLGSSMIWLLRIIFMGPKLSGVYKLVNLGVYQVLVIRTICCSEHCPYFRRLYRPPKKKENRSGISGGPPLALHTVSNVFHTYLLMCHLMPLNIWPGPSNAGQHWPSTKKKGVCLTTSMMYFAGLDLGR